MFKRTPRIDELDAWVETRLSDYLDGALSPPERARVEAHLQVSPRARASLDALRWTVQLLRETPAPALPRQFTLPVSTRVVRASAPAWMVWGLRGVAVAASVAFVILLAGTLLRTAPNNQTAVMQNAAPVAPSAMVALAPTLNAPAPPPAPAQDQAADTNNSPAPLMVTEASAPLMETTAQADASSSANAQPPATQAKSQTQDGAPPTATRQAKSNKPTAAAAAPQAEATSAAVGASNATVVTPAPATADAATQRTFAAQAIQATVTAARLRVRAGPGPQYRGIGELKRGEQILVIGRNADSSWLTIQYEKNPVTGQGWVAAAFVKLTAAPETLPIVTEYGSPDFVPTDLAPTAAPTVEGGGTPEQPTGTPEG